MADLADSARLFVRLTAAHARGQMQYRASFALQVLGHFIGSFLDFVAILVIFANVPVLGGWTAPEVALLYGISNLSFALTDLVIGHLDRLPQLIREGAFDLVLIRPRSTLFQIVTADFQLRRLGKVAQGAVVLGFALSVLPIDWTPERVAVLLVTIPAAVVIFGAIWIAAICISSGRRTPTRPPTPSRTAATSSRSTPSTSTTTGSGGSSRTSCRPPSSRTSRRSSSSARRTRSACPSGSR